MWVSEGFSYYMLLRWKGIYGCVGLVLACVLFISCSGLSLGGTTTKSPLSASADVALAKLHWCGKVLMIFRDEGAGGTGGTAPSAGTATVAPGTPTAVVATPATAATTPTPTTLTDWQQVKSELGFTPYLPVTLPAGTCLVSAYGMVHDPILGGSFTIGYLLPDHSAVTFSEAPLSAQNKNAQFQCNVMTSSDTTTVKKSGTPVATSSKATLPLQDCTGVRTTTSVVFSARGTTASLHGFFNALQPNVNWVPAAS